MQPLQSIETKTRKLADCRRDLSEKLLELRSETDAVTKKYIQGIRTAMNKVQRAQSALRDALEANPEAFEKPKTRVFNDIRVGFQRQKDKLVLPDNSALVAAIRKHFPEQESLLIKVTESPVRSGLAQLTDAELKRLKAKREPGSDEVIIKPADGDVEKYAAAVLDG